jgi:phosphoglycerol transferase
LILDSTYFLKDPSNQKFYNKVDWWGFSDKFVYENAKKVIVEQSRQDKNFFSVVMTIDTHIPGKVFGYYPPVYGDKRDAFVEADHLIGEFIDWLKEQPFYDNTVIIILGDHLYMSEKISDTNLPPRSERRIYNVFINSSRDLPEEKRHRICSTLDMAPTILEAIGVTLPERKLGLGVSLFSDEPTLIETYGQSNLNDQLNTNSKLYNSFF